MTTKNTLEDLRFAEGYVDFVSRRAMDPVTRARAKMLQAAIAMLDRHHPTWRKDLLSELDKLNCTREIKDIFPLPDVDQQVLFDGFMKLVLPENTGDGNTNKG
jgi:hypothetical protein